MQNLNLRLGWISPASFLCFLLSPLGAAEGYLHVGGKVQRIGLSVPNDLAPFTDLAAGWDHVVAIRMDGSLAAWGLNDRGQAQVPVTAKATQVAAGAKHSLCLLEDGQVLGWGDNSWGQAQIPPLPHAAIAIAAGGFHSLALLKDGSVVAWGADNYRQSSPPVGIGPAKSIAAGAYFSAAVLEDGTVRIWGYTEDELASGASGLADLVRIACGFRHCLAQKSDGSLLSWGSNERGQIEVPPESFVQFAAGGYGSAGLTEEGRAVFWGDPGFGAREDAEGFPSMQQITLGHGFVAGIGAGPAFLLLPGDQVKEEGKAVQFEAMVAGQAPFTFQWLADGTEIAGADEAQLLIPDMEVQYGTRYQLRVQNAEGEARSRAARLLHPPIIAVQPQDAAVFQGRTARFEVEVTSPEPVQIQWFHEGVILRGATAAGLEISNASFRERGEYHVSVANQYGTVVSDTVSLSLESVPNLNLQASSGVVAYGSQASVSAVSLTGATWKFNGGVTDLAGNEMSLDRAYPLDGGSFQLEYVSAAGVVEGPVVDLQVLPGHHVQKTGRPLTIKAGRGFGTIRSYQWLKDGEVIPGADGPDLELLHVTTAEEGFYSVRVEDAGGSRVVGITDLLVLPAEPAGRIVDWRQNPSLPADLGNAVDVAATATETWVLFADGTVVLWEGRGSAAVPRQLYPDHQFVAMDGEGTTWAGITVEGKVMPPPWGISEAFVDVAVGDGHVLGLTRDGRVVAWGSNNQGQANVSQDLGPVIAIDASGGHSLALRANGTVAAWGANQMNQTSVPTSLRDVVEIAAGPVRNLALKSNGQVVAWGNGASVPALDAEHIFADFGGLYAIRRDGSLLAWGPGSEPFEPFPQAQDVVMTQTGLTIRGGAVPIIARQPVPLMVENGRTGLLHALVWSEGDATFQWYRDGEAVAGATSDTLEAAVSGRYFLRAANSHGMTQSAEVEVEILPSPILSLPERTGSVVLWGNVTELQREQIAGVRNAVAVQVVDGQAYVFDEHGLAATGDHLSRIPMPSPGLVQLAIKRDGGTFGLTKHGVLGTLVEDVFQFEPDSQRIPITQIAAHPGRLAAVRADGSFFHNGGDELFSEPLTDIVQVAVGAQHMALLRSDGTVLEADYGSSSERPVPMPGDLPRIIDIKAGGSHTLALAADGSVYAWGGNDWKQAQVPLEAVNVVQIAAGYAHSLALLADGTVLAWGGSSLADASKVPGLTNVIAISASGAGGTSAALVAGPVLEAGPEDAEAQEGASISFEVRARAAETLSYQWFHNGSLLPEQTEPSLHLEDLELSQAGHYQVQVESGGYVVRAGADLRMGEPALLLKGLETCFVMEGDAVELQVEVANPEGVSFRWFFEDEEIPNATGSVLDLGAATVEKAGMYEARALTEHSQETRSLGELKVVQARPMGRVVQWGKTPGMPEGLNGIVEIAAGTGHVLALRADGTVVAWGDNGHRQTSVPSGLKRVVAVTAGAGHSLALTADGRVAGWGMASHGRLAPPTAEPFAQLHASGSSNAGVLRNGEVLIWGWWHAPSASLVEFQGAMGLAVGDRHVLGFNENRELLAWGENDMGQLNFPPLSDVVRVAAFGKQSAVLTAAGKLWVRGNNLSGQAAIPDGLPGVFDVETGIGKTLAVMEDGTVRSWGAEAGTPPEELAGVFQAALGHQFDVALVRTDLFIAQPPQPAVVVEGQRLELSVSAFGISGLFYQWLKDGVAMDGETDSTLIIEQTQPGDQGTYSVRVTSPFTSEETAAASVEIRQAPSINGWSDWRLVQENQPVVLSGEVSGDPPITFSWSRDGESLPGQDQNELVLPKVDADQAGTYELTAENQVGRAGAVVRLYVLTGAADRWYEGDRVRLSVSGPEVGGLTFEWEIDGITAGESDSELVMEAVVPGVMVELQGVLENKEVMGTRLDLPVLPAAPSILKEPVSASLLLGEGLVLEVEAIGRPPLGYQWYHNGEMMDGETAPALNLSNAGFATAGEYRVEVTNTAGKARSMPADVEVALRPNVVAWGKQGASGLDIPKDLTDAIAADASHHCLALRADGTVVAWGQNDAGQASVPAGLKEVVAVAAGLEHSLVLQADGTVAAWGNNEHGAGSVPGDLYPVPVVAIATDRLHNLVLHEDGKVSAWGYGLQGQSDVPEDLPPVAGIAAGSNSSGALLHDGSIRTWGTFSNHGGLTGVQTLSAGAHRFLAVMPNGTVQGWSGLSAPSREGPIQVAQADTQSWVRTDENNNTFINSHNVAVLKNGTVAVWGEEATGIFSPPLGLENVIQVAAGAMVNLAVIQPAPQIVQQPVGGDFPIGASVSLFVEAQGDSPHAFQWLRNGEMLEAATGPVLNLPSLQLEDAGTYSVRVSGSRGSATSRAVWLRPISDRPAILEQPASRVAKRGDAVLLEVMAVGAMPLRYQWRRNGVALAGENGPALEFSLQSEDQYGAYDVLVSNQAGSDASALAFLTRGATIIIQDNREAELDGLWQSKSSPFALSSEYASTESGFGQSTAQWRVELPHAGRWKVSVHNPRVFAIHPPFHVADGSGGVAVQPPMSRFSQWQILGEFQFSEGQPAIITASDAFPDRTTTAVIDGIRLEYVPRQFQVIGPLDQTVFEGGDVELNVSVDSSGPVHVRWLKDGASLGTSSSTRLYLPDVSLSDGGEYQAWVWNSDGARLTRAASLVVDAKPGARISINGNTLSWEAGYILESASDVGGPYQEVTNAVAPFDLEPHQTARRFFRLRKP